MQLSMYVFVEMSFFVHVHVRYIVTKIIYLKKYMVHVFVCFLIQTCWTSEVGEKHQIYLKIKQGTKKVVCSHGDHK